MGGEALAAAVVAGEVRGVARALTVVEGGGAPAQALLSLLKGRSAAVRTVGVTGAPGVGKSSLVQTLGLELLRRHGRLAVLAVDPTSPFSGGALLGDRVRMPDLAARGVFVRSMASRGALGGLAGATSDAVDVLAAAGFGWVLIETVGVGQAEVDIAGEADTCLVVTTAGAGDDVQAAKAGLLEIGDIFVVNKTDRPGSDQQVDILLGMLELRPDSAWHPPVLRTGALSGEGIAALADAVDAHQSYLGDGDRRAALHHRRAVRRIERALSELAWRSARSAVPGVFERTAGAVAAGELDPYTAAAELWRAVGREGL